MAHVSSEPLSSSPADALIRPPLGSKKSSLEAVPQCWGHRGASAAFPENTLASFEAAIRDGAEGIESDVHITEDDEIVMFHDPHLDRTTNGTGRIQTQKYHGVLDQLRTNKSPHQKIPTLRETLELLMRPENQKVFLNIDVKVDNEPERLFSLIHKLVSVYDDFETVLAPRLVLGLWHPKYVEPARRLVPYLRLAHIGMSPSLARRYFWDACGSFSMSFSCLVGSDGVAFRDECKRAGKDLYVWTVNSRREMIEATKWGAKAILTDKTDEWLSLRFEMENDWEKVSKETSWRFAYTSVWYSSIANYFLASWESYLLTKVAGSWDGPHAAPTSAVPMSSVGVGVTASS
ncbi:SPOSA6832_00764 [Sporobolomyces salmonicolor]|uniref:SPOSA6832_00764-mRNA-1:cds n=1 Tax=Sporidiobolus salmonicolor TaxID=5005 RepID=A0A0D6EH89_SPOSA|nr:SPOSA6832_00764 [Sporobolomyces salmonicolor]